MNLDYGQVRKLTYRINTAILLLVFFLAGFFYICKAEFLVWFSIPTALVYVLSYVLIYKNKLYTYVMLVYFWLTFYMTVTTFCLGTNFGFQLYCLSMIPIIFYTEYLGRKFEMKPFDALPISIVIVVFYLLSTGYSSFYGPVYEVNYVYAGVFRLFNSLIVISFLVFYSRLMLRIVRQSEDQLEDIANKDQLTGLYNRRSMITKLEAAYETGTVSFLAMADIDNFKHINDTYGHNAGDYVLRNVSRLMREVCPESDIARWGGEEFLILSRIPAEPDGVALIEKLRSAIEQEEFVFEGEHIKVTITAGLSELRKDYIIDKWIKEADDNLYYGKNHGKNMVVRYKAGRSTGD